jgi:predicted Fe-Mo cluster-binding NifX family protein
MRIAIPVVQGRLSPHFGHCEEFALFDVDPEKKEIVANQSLPSPEHQPGLLPQWLHEQGATIIIAGGMGGRAQDLFAQNGIHVVVGAPSEEPGSIVKAYLDNTLQAGDNVCDHGPDHECGH